MSQSEEKSEDKKDIEMEEREKIMNAENIAQDKTPTGDGTREVSKLKTDIQEGREVKPKKIPIGGIQMPGFFTRSKSKEKCKDSESEHGGTDIESSELLENGSNKGEQSTPEAAQPQRVKLPNPFAKPEQAQQRKSLMESIRAPLSSAFPRKPAATTAGLASVETLDDSDGVKCPHTDAEDPDAPCTARIRPYRVALAALLLFIIAVILIVLYAVQTQQFSGGSTSPIRDGKYVTAVTSCGFVEGTIEDGAFVFRDIPYALAPSDENRWRPARSLNNLTYCWNGTLLVHNASSVCAQTYADGSIGGDEDCLTLDVVTPRVGYEAPLPVVVLIGAESMTGGSPAKMRPSPQYARSRDVVFVRPNFRLGALGFLALKELSASVHPPTSGNYGLGDILEALRWIQLNIEHFGGDRDSVTLFGHRAGASLVIALAASAPTKPLFTRVWAASPSAIYPTQDLAESEKMNEVYIAETDCKDAACLRTLPVDQVMRAVPDTWRRPIPDLPHATDPAPHHWLVMDGVIVRQAPSIERAAASVPLVVGTTAHAAHSPTLRLRHTNWTSELIRNHVNASRLNLTEELRSNYPDTYTGLASLVSDVRVVCPLLNATMAASGDKPPKAVYIVTEGRGDPPLADIDSDVEAILGRYEPRSPKQRRYLTAMQQLFYHYVSHGELPLEERSPLLLVGQDAMHSREYEPCTRLQSAGLALDQYAQLD